MEQKYRVENEVYKVNPIIIYPKCIIDGGTQHDCHDCNNKDNCIVYQPRCMCIRPYKDHISGCPNFNVLPTCPPNIPCMYDEVFDVSDVYAVVTKFYKKEYFDYRRRNRPDLAEGQIRNIRVWQPITKKENDYAVSKFYQDNPDKYDYVATRLLECMGVDVVNTMKEHGVIIKFPDEDYSYRISFVSRVYEEALEKYGYEIHEESNRLKRGMKTLVLRK